MTAAVGDFAPQSIHKEKIKKQGESGLTLHLQPTPDILQSVAKHKSGQFIVGFAAESENVVQAAADKLKRKRLDLIAANDISAPGIGFQSDHNQITLIDKAGKVETLPHLSKMEIADLLLDRILERIQTP